MNNKLEEFFDFVYRPYSPHINELYELFHETFKSVLNQFTSVTSGHILCTFCPYMNDHPEQLICRKNYLWKKYKILLTN